MPKRILLAGLFHETHTFLPGRTELADFLIRRGPQMLEAEGDASPLAAALEVAREEGWTVCPTVDYRATPSAIVADEVFEQFWSELEASAREAMAGGMDGVLLVLHGAMACASFLDAEGELLARLRRLLAGSEAPICGVLDLHANFTQQMADLSDGLVAYRENPHTDAHEASARAARLLAHVLRSGRRPAHVWQSTPLMWPPPGVGTADDPMRTLEALSRQFEAEDGNLLAVNVLAGYSFADLHDTGVSFSAVTDGDRSDAAAKLRRLAQWAVDHREQGNRLAMPLAQVAPLLKQHQEGPVLLVEPSDNIGGGAPGDATGILAFLLEQRIEGAAVAICDPEAVSQLAGLNAGQRMSLAIGGKATKLGGPPLLLEVEFISRSAGKFRLEDPHSHLASMCGMEFDMGPTAVVRHAGVTILLNSHKTPPFDLGQWRSSQGIQPERLRVIGVKAAVAHRRGYDPITKASYTVETPGSCASDLRKFPFKNVRRPIYPLDDLPPGYSVA